jgi:hypothetical protein
MYDDQLQKKHTLFSINKVVKYKTWKTLFVTGNCVCQNCGFCYLDSDAGPQEGSCDGVNEDSLAEYGRYVARVSDVET